MSRLSQEQIKAGCEAARKLVDDYSKAASAMVTDDMLQQFVLAIAIAVVNAGGDGLDVG